MTVKRETGFEACSDRYKYDFRKCRPQDGWAQVDTRQDASYFGTWANPTTRQIVCYCEGDLTLTACDTNEEFTVEMLATIDWNKSSGYWIGIDGMCSPPIINAFKRLGFEKELH